MHLISSLFMNPHMINACFVGTYLILNDFHAREHHFSKKKTILATTTTRRGRVEKRGNIETNELHEIELHE